MLALLPAVIAAEPAHYHPDRVAQSSQLFARYAEALGPSYETAQRTLTDDSLALERLERAVLLLGDRAGEDLTSWSAEQKQLLTHQYLRTQAHISLLEDDSSAIFTAAMEQALTSYADRSPVECSGPSSVMALIGPGGRSASASCEGESLNAALAAHIDADAALNAAVDEILAIAWPDLGIEPAEQAVVELTGTEGYVQLHELAELFDRELDRMADTLEGKLRPYEGAIAAGDQAAMAQAVAVRERYELAMAEAGNLVLDAAAKALKKGPAVGICANPEALGGCAGADRTDEVLPMLAAHKKVQRALD